MKILKRTADRLKKENHAELALYISLKYGMKMTRQGVNIWVHRRSIPDKYIPAVEEYVGVRIK